MFVKTPLTELKQTLLAPTGEHLSPYTLQNDSVPCEQRIPRDPLSKRTIKVRFVTEYNTRNSVERLVESTTETTGRNTLLR